MPDYTTGEEPHKGCWHPHNIIREDGFHCMNFFRFFIQCLLFLGINSSIFLTMYYAHLANINVGVITTIWSVQPLVASIFDFILNGERF
jgi:drug/metabolite transporter (DMT)-like permease